MKKIMIIYLGMLFLLLNQAIIFADEESDWKNISGEWYYYDESGNMTSGWQQVHGIWYYMDDSGVMQTD